MTSPLIPGRFYDYLYFISENVTSAERETYLNGSIYNGANIIITRPGIDQQALVIFNIQQATSTTQTNIAGIVRGSWKTAWYASNVVGTNTSVYQGWGTKDLETKYNLNPTGVKGITLGELDSWNNAVIRVIIEHNVTKNIRVAVWISRDTDESA